MMWDEEKIEWLKKNYPKKGKMYCAECLGVNEASIRAKASKLKLKIDKDSDFFKEFQSRAAGSKIGKKRPLHSKAMKDRYLNGLMDFTKMRSPEARKRVSERTKKWISENGHPRGFLGGKHDDKAKAKISKKSKNAWKKLTKKEVKLIKYRARVTRLKNKTIVRAESMHTRGIGGKRADLDNQYFRSKQEANFTRYLKYSGIGYEYETKHFFFDGLRKGATSYTPDFYIPSQDKYIEFKGWLDAKSVTKLKRFKKYFPSEFAKLEIVKQSLRPSDREVLLKIGFPLDKIIDYKNIQAMSANIPHWEH